MFEPHRRHYAVSLSKNINPSLVLVQPRKTHPFITERSLMGLKKSNQTKSTFNTYIPPDRSVLLIFFSFLSTKTYVVGN